MSSIQHLEVTPKLPTVLGDQTRLDLMGHDIDFLHVRTVHVVPTKLDVSRFEDALSRVLQLYPHAAGKMRHIEGRWVIELTNSAIPLDLEHKLDSSPGSYLNDTWVVQDSVSTFMDINPIGLNLLDDSAPLLFAKLTFFENETCVGLAWQHSLGDATMRLRFVHTLSQFYQGLSSGFAAPSFERYQFPTASESVVAKIWPDMPRFHKSCHFTEAPMMMMMMKCENVRWRIDSRDLEELQSALSSKKQDGPPISKQDCLTAYLVAVVNSTRSNPVRSVKYVISYRNVKAPFIAENEAGNMLLETNADVPVDMAGIAAAVRNAVIHGRDPEYIHDWMSVSSKISLETYNAGKIFPYIGPEDEVIINAVRMLDFCSAHFGCPEGTQYYMEGVLPNWVRVTRSNPVKGADGVWRTPESVEISLGVAPEVKPKILETLALGVRHILKGEQA